MVESTIVRSPDVAETALRGGTEVGVQMIDEARRVIVSRLLIPMPTAHPQGITAGFLVRRKSMRRIMHGPSQCLANRAQRQIGMVLLTSRKRAVLHAWCHDGRMRLIIFDLVESVLYRTGMYPLWRAWQRRRQLAAWFALGRPTPPPPVVKQNTIRQYALKYGVTTLVETGTYLGDTLFALKDNVNNLYSIELDEYLYYRARKRFQPYPHVHLLLGDSAHVLPILQANLDGPCLFWLDGHYSGGITAKGAANTPIIDELETILARPEPGDVILIDDARCFDGKDNYPTIDELRRLLLMRRPSWMLAVSDDIIRIHPPSQVALVN